MRRIYHIVRRAAWDSTASDPYRADSLATEGFIHCSNQEQIPWVLDQFYTDDTELLLLEIDVHRLTSPLRDEDPGIGQRFPHIYGPLNRPAIVAVREIQRGPDGRWALPWD